MPSRSEPFDRRDALAVLHHGKRHARKNAATVDEHRAGTAFATIARFLGAREVQFLAQCVGSVARGSIVMPRACSLTTTAIDTRGNAFLLHIGGDRIASARERDAARGKTGELHEFASIDRHTPNLRRNQVRGWFECLSVALYGR